MLCPNCIKQVSGTVYVEPGVVVCYDDFGHTRGIERMGPVVRITQFNCACGMNASMKSEWMPTGESVGYVRELKRPESTT